MFWYKGLWLAYYYIQRMSGMNPDLNCVYPPLPKNNNNKKKSILFCSREIRWLGSTDPWLYTGGSLTSYTTRGGRHEVCIYSSCPRHMELDWETFYNSYKAALVSSFPYWQLPCQRFLMFVLRRFIALCVSLNAFWRSVNCIFITSLGIHGMKTQYRNKINPGIAVLQHANSVPIVSD